MIQQGNAKKEVEKSKTEKLEAQKEREKFSYDFVTNIDEIEDNDSSELFTSNKTNLNLLTLKNVSIDTTAVIVLLLQYVMHY